MLVLDNGPRFVALRKQNQEKLTIKLKSFTFFTVLLSVESLTGMLIIYDINPINF